MFSWVMQEHMNVEECQAAGSTPFMSIVSIPYTPVFRLVTSVLISLHLTLTLTSPLIFKQWKTFSVFA